MRQYTDVLIATRKMKIVDKVGRITS